MKTALLIPVWLPVHPGFLTALSRLDAQMWCVEGKSMPRVQSRPNGAHG